MSRTARRSLAVSKSTAVLVTNNLNDVEDEKPITVLPTKTRQTKDFRQSLIAKDIIEEVNQVSAIPVKTRPSQDLRKDRMLQDSIE